jgi:hypothetical protein
MSYVEAAQHDQACFYDNLQALAAKAANRDAAQQAELAAAQQLIESQFKALTAATPSAAAAGVGQAAAAYGEGAKQRKLSTDEEVRTNHGGMFHGMCAVMRCWI